MERPATTDELGPPHDPGGERTAALDDARPRRFGPHRDPTEPLDAGPARILPERLVLGRYRLERRLGAGGFGVVWLAFDEKLEREVAVKVIAGDGDEPVPERAAREARVAARLNHPGIVSLYELGEDEHAVYLVSELVPGRTLGDLIRAGAVSDRDVARIGAALCDALDHAHDRKVVHRDVKPQNVIVVAEPAAGAGFAKLADFGVAQLAVGDRLTRTGDVVGTLAYMAPEQAEGARVTAAADVYSLALTLYEAWSGANPVRGPTPAATARRLGRRLPALSAYRPDLPHDLCAWVDAALDPVPARRPPVGVLRDALAGAVDELSDAGGLVEPETRDRVGLPPTEAVPLRSTRAEDLVSRALAGLAAGGLLVAGVEALGPDPAFSLTAATAAAVAATALLPRIGWLLVALGFTAWLGSELVDGTALVVGVSLAAVPLLLPRGGRLWSVPAVAPLLGAVAIGPAFVGVAALASTAWRRAGLAAAGFLWLAVAEVVTSDALLYGPPVDADPRSEWARSLDDAVGDALGSLVASPALLPALAWAAFAVVLPLVVRGRSLALDVGAALVWAAALVAAHAGLAGLLEDTVARGDARGAAAGAAIGAFAAVGAVWSGVRPRPARAQAVP
ncbi:MAG TPA: serine/threonine-protein kinase [Thermoleophilaceae bacterium]